MRRIIFISTWLLIGAACTSDSSDSSSGQDQTQGASNSESATTSSVSTSTTTAPDRTEEAGAIESSTTSTTNPAVADLEDPVDRTAEVLALAEQIAASHLIVRDDHAIYARSGEQQMTFAADEFSGAWGDENFVYIHTWTPDDADGKPGAVHSTARSYDGTVVCKLDEPIHHVTEWPIGTFVAGVQREPEWNDENARSYPMFAIDCVTGVEQSIAPQIVREGEAEWFEQVIVGARMFDVHFDAEGNADVLNESGTSINGDDYAGYHVFSQDGSQVIYGDMRNFIHVSTTIISRDTTTAEELWRAETEVPFYYLGFSGENVIASTPAEFDPSFESGTASVVVIDRGSGDVLDEIETTLDLIVTR